MHVWYKYKYSLCSYKEWGMFVYNDSTSTETSGKCDVNILNFG